MVNSGMAIFQGNKEIVVGSKVSREENEELIRVCEKEDRSMSYVLRVLAMRGLAYYKTDGLLKITPEEELMIKGKAQHSKSNTPKGSGKKSNKKSQRYIKDNDGTMIPVEDEAPLEPED